MPPSSLTLRRYSHDLASSFFSFFLSNTTAPAAASTQVTEGICPHNIWGLLTSVCRDVVGPGGDKVVVHLFEWSWKDVERECENLSKWGYWGVQVRTPL